MMEDFSSISLLSLAMLVGCYVAGTIPLAVNFSEVGPVIAPFHADSSDGSCVFGYSFSQPPSLRGCAHLGLFFCRRS